MGPEKRAMQKAADLMKLDAKGISPPALISIMQGQFHTALQHPGMVALVAQRRERLRRLQEEIKSPGMHVKPEKPPAGQMGAEEMGPPGMMPMAPGSPVPPSNHLGMYPPVGGAPGMPPAGGAPGMAAGAGMQPAAAVLTRFAKRAIGEPETPVKEKPPAVEAAGQTAQRHSFKYGFFRKIAECGLLPKQFEALMLKHAGSLIVPGPIGGAAAGAQALGGGLGWAGKKLKAVGKLGVVAPIAITLPLLFGLGMAGRHLTKPEYETPEELRSIERLALYKRLGREASMRASKLQKRRKVRLTARGEKTQEPEVKVPELGRSA